MLIFIFMLPLSLLFFAAVIIAIRFTLCRRLLPPTPLLIR